MPTLPGAGHRSLGPDPSLGRRLLDRPVWEPSWGGRNVGATSFVLRSRLLCRRSDWPVWTGLLSWRSRGGWLT